MVKCPNCGSTAQVKPIKLLTSFFSVPSRESTQSRRYKCGCGCSFTHHLIVNYKEEFWREEYSDIKMKKVIDYFHLNHAYEFDITDITALIYTICAVGVICGCDMTILFFIGSTIATIFCWQARRLNLVLLNVALFAMNCYYLICLIIG